MLQIHVMAEGPSPRARGSPIHIIQLHARVGSIPASAGEPRATRRALVGRQTVHPRERGGAWTAPESRSHRDGPSPRARGSHVRAHRGVPHVGSIPASAGGPPIPACRRLLSEVHPRERGGAQLRETRAFVEWGPSPRARGSRANAGTLFVSCGSIPASAGEPCWSTRRRAGRRVHPRERGGASRRRRRGILSAGPSPRARGSLPLRTGTRSATGSIPASAGEPTTRLRCLPWSRVHPRERGGAYPCVPEPGQQPGPSPRARGSLSSPASRDSERGSIPASAGEPIDDRCTGDAQSVHPRERGGALADWSTF